jgi:hypothetical protein
MSGKFDEAAEFEGLMKAGVTLNPETGKYFPFVLMIGEDGTVEGRRLSNEFDTQEEAIASYKAELRPLLADVLAKANEICDTDCKLTSLEH